MRKHALFIASVVLCVGVVAAAYGADAATRVPTTSRATLLVPAAGDHELAVGTAVPLSEVSDIAFATSRVGYALGGPLGSTFPLKTVNGGRRWFIDGPAFFLPVADGAAAVGDMSAASASEAYAYGGPGAGSSIAITTDGGKQWWRAWLGQALVAVSQRGSDLWALAAGPTRSSSVNAVPLMLLYDSADGGRTWTYRSTLSSVRGWEADLVRPSATTAFALVKPFNPDRASHGGIVQTMNGGATWTNRSDPCTKMFSTYAVDWIERLAASSTRSLWLFCGSQPSTGIQTKLVERSANGGRTWTLVASNTPGEHVPANDISLEGELPNTGTAGDLVVNSQSDASLILIGNNVLWKTTDGGHTWTHGAPPTVEAQFLQDISTARGSAFVKTQNALWTSSATGWKLVVGTSKPY
jgi:photosystem II stability/assembly factor-like uncharacterized protein